MLQDTQTPQAHLGPISQSFIPHVSTNAKSLGREEGMMENRSMLLLREDAARNKSPNDKLAQSVNHVSKSAIKSLESANQPLAEIPKINQKYFYTNNTIIEENDNFKLTPRLSGTACPQNESRPDMYPFFADQRRLAQAQQAAEGPGQGVPPERDAEDAYSLKESTQSRQLISNLLSSKVGTKCKKAHHTRSSTYDMTDQIKSTDDNQFLATERLKFQLQDPAYQLQQPAQQHKKKEIFDTKYLVPAEKLAAHSQLKLLVVQPNAAEVNAHYQLPQTQTSQPTSELTSEAQHKLLFDDFKETSQRDLEDQAFLRPKVGKDYTNTQFKLQNKAYSSIFLPKHLAVPLVGDQEVQAPGSNEGEQAGLLSNTRATGSKMACSSSHNNVPPHAGSGHNASSRGVRQSVSELYTEQDYAQAGKLAESNEVQFGRQYSVQIEDLSDRLRSVTQNDEGVSRHPQLVVEELEEGENNAVPSELREDKDLTNLGVRDDAKRYRLGLEQKLQQDRKQPSKPHSKKKPGNAAAASQKKDRRYPLEQGKPVKKIDECNENDVSCSSKEKHTAEPHSAFFKDQQFFVTTVDYKEPGA